MREAEPWVYDTIPALRAELQLLANGSSDAGPWLRRALPVPISNYSHDFHQEAETVEAAAAAAAAAAAEQLQKAVLMALWQLHDAVGAASCYFGLCSYATIVKMAKSAVPPADPDFIAALTERFLGESDRVRLSRELVSDGAMLRSLSEDDLTSIGIKSMQARQTAWAARKQELLYMRMVIDGILDESAMLEGIVTLVHDTQFAAEFNAYEARLRATL
jgi:hypothetical protein